MAVVKLYANLRVIIGGMELHIPGKDVHSVLVKLTRDFPALAPFLFESGKLRPRVILTLNGRTLDRANCMSTLVAEQDQIAIFPPVAGG